MCQIIIFLQTFNVIIQLGILLVHSRKEFPHVVKHGKSIIVYTLVSYPKLNQIMFLWHYKNQGGLKPCMILNVTSMEVGGTS